MNTPARSTHPLILAAAASVTLFSLTGVASLAGWLPFAYPAPAPATAPAPTARLAVAAGEVGATASGAAARARVNEQPARPVVDRPPTRSARGTQPTAEPALPPPIASGRNVPAFRPVADSAAQDRGIPADGAFRPLALCRDCGTVESVREIRQDAAGPGLGAVAGGLLGGLLGNQVGKGRGRTVGAVVGALGGAFAGHEVERQVRGTTSYQVTVRMDDGSVRTINESQAPAWREGDRVRVGGEQLTGV